MADWHGIRQAIATKGANVAGINKSSADSLDSGLEHPVLLVLDTGAVNVLERGPGYELRRADIKGVLALSRGPLTGQATATADDIIEALFVEFRTGIQLGYTGTVQDSWLDSADADDEVTIGGVDYLGYRLTWPVVVRENVTRSAT